MVAGWRRPDPHRTHCSREMNNSAHFGKSERPQLVGQGHFQPWQVGGVGSIITFFLIQIQQALPLIDELLGSRSRAVSRAGLSSE